MSLDLALQKAIRARLIATPAVTDLVSASSILDRNKRPAPSPSIILGETQEIDPGSALKRNQTRIYHTLHVWKVEENLTGVKAICGAIRAAILQARLDLGSGFHCIDWRISTMRTMRDPDGETSHGVVTIDVLAEEVI